MAFVDNHPSGSILATKARMYFAPLPANSRTPVTHTFTTGAAVVGATTITLTSTAAASVVKGATLKTSAGLTVVADEAKAFVANAATPLAVKPVEAAIASAATLTTINERLLRGVQNIGRPAKTNLISIRSMESGLGNEQRPVMIDFNMPVDGWIYQGDEVFGSLSAAAFSGDEVYVILESPDNERQKGPAIVSNLDRPIKIDDVMKFTVDVIFQGIPIRETIT